MFSSVLVANRGEIAVRIIRTLRRMGIRSIAVYSDVDAGSRHVGLADLAVRIGPGSLAESYLSVDRILDAAVRVGAEALHPGYGFLSEAPGLARACEAADVVFVGPPASAIELMGDKIRAKQTVAAAGIPTVPGRTVAGLSDAELTAAAHEVGFPVLLKPSAGGGGKGMRLADDGAGLGEQIASARREAVAAFGDGTLFVERYLPAARHLEVQVVADAHGSVVHLGERECSLQRRHQKIVEESPSPLLDDGQRARLGGMAVRVAQAGGYVNAGTVEFLVNAHDPDEAYFMEMNARLQVEHPVTEEVWGVDLVELQLRVAAGEALSIDQETLVPRGHAVEARIYAEDPWSGFLPTGGRIVRLREPAADLARVESGLSEGTFVGPAFDPLLAKVVTWAPDRPSALRRLDRALASTEILGVTTNTGFLRALLATEPVQAGEIDTGLVERLAPELPRGDPEAGDLAAGAVVALLTSARPEGVWDLSGWRIGGRCRSRWVAEWRGRPVVAHLEQTAGGWSVELDGDGRRHLVGLDLRDGRASAVVDGTARHYGAARVAEGVWLGRDGSAWFLAEPEAVLGESAPDAARHVASPLPGAVTAVLVHPGERVEAGATLVVVEAMKMEHALRASRPGRVATLGVDVGDQVVLGQVVVELEGVDDGV